MNGMGWGSGWGGGMTTWPWGGVGQGRTEPGRLDGAETPVIVGRKWDGGEGVRGGLKRAPPLPTVRGPGIFGVRRRICGLFGVATDATARYRVQRALLLNSRAGSDG